MHIDGLESKELGRIAVLGTGRMGRAVATRLATHGHNVAVWNRSHERTSALASAGITIEPTAEAAVSDADIVIVLLADGEAVDKVLCGPGGVADAIRPTAVLVQMSAIGPDATESLRQRLPQHVNLLDAPVIGSVPQVREGELVILAAGAPTVVNRMESALSCLGTVKPCGTDPAASALKVLMNASMISSIVALKDMYQLGQKLGLSDDVLTGTLRSGPLSAAMARSEASEADFPIGLALKDLDLALGEASDMPLLQTAREQLAGEETHAADLATIVKKQPQPEGEK